MGYRRGLTGLLAAGAWTLLTACGAARDTAAPAPPEAPAAPAAAVAQHDNFNAVLWVQTAAEYQALTRQAYTAAQLALDEALDDPTWTASLEQEARGDFAALPPAVVLDVDETVLDNSAYQARLVRDGGAYTSAGWAAWTAEAAAPPIAGALAYTREAAARGVAVVYVTNRKAAEEAATVENLRRLGFPLGGDDGDADDRVLTRGERPAWASSDKTPRRAHVAGRYRIVQLVGDNLGDFVEAEGTPAERRAAAERYADYWGLRWIVLPNPTYGNWEGALFGRDFTKTPEQRRAKKSGELRYN